MKREIINKFMNAAVLDRGEARRLFEQHPQLRDTRVLWGESILHYLAVEEYTDAVRFLLDLGFDVDAEDDDGETALHSAALLGYVDMVELLLAHGARTEVHSDSFGTALQEAVEHGYVRIVDMLLTAGADHTVRDIIFNETIFDLLPEDAGKRSEILAVFDKHGLRPPDP
jgi:ankyrin repeat protein